MSAAPARKGGASRTFVLIFAGVAIAIMCGLGVWQVQRLAWKTALLADIESRMDAAPVALADALKGDPACLDARFTAVTLTGTVTGRPLRLMATRGGSAAHRVLVALDAGDGVPVFADLGAVPDRAPLPALDGPVTVTGLLRCREAPSTFSPPGDHAAGLFFIADLPDMGRAAGVGANPAFYVEAMGPGGGPPDLDRREGRVLLDTIPNSHLAYAITWFSLAGTLFIITILFLARRRAAA